MLNYFTFGNFSIKNSFASYIFLYEKGIEYDELL